MIRDLAEGGVEPRLDSSVCVVGAGAVGLSLATALARKGVDVVLLEGGGSAFEGRSQALQRGESIGHPFSSIDMGRYRILGGTTTLWGGQVLPFDGFVTSERPWLGHGRWPIPVEELQRYFRRAYSHIGLETLEHDDERIWAELGVPAPLLGADLQLELTRWVRTRNFAKLFRAELRDSRGPMVILHANAVSLDADATGRVHAVRARSLDGHSITVRAKSFVLSNGTLEIVRLLKHPLHDGSHARWSRSPWLGAPLIDHLDCFAGSVKLLDHERFHDAFDSIYLNGRKYYPKLRLAPRAQRTHGLVDIAAQFAYRSRLSEHLDYMKQFARSVRDSGADVSIRDLPEHLASILRISAPLILRYLRNRRSFKPADSQVSLFFFCEQLPTSRSRIDLGEETDALGLRRLRVDWQIDGRELETMRFFGRLIKDQLDRLGLAQVQLDPRLEELDPAFLRGVGDAVHHMGVARLAASAEEGFVDSDLKVFGSENLFIAGAAVFPSTGFANPTFTAIALALRLADQLHGSLRTAR